MTDLWQQELSGNLHLGCALREVAEESTFLLNEERLGQQLDTCLEDLDPLLQLTDEIVQLR